jgi:hypothetical protein
MKTRTLLIILGLCAVIFGGLGYYFQAQKPNENLNLKTYNNDLIGFSFVYPADHTPFETVDQVEEKLVPATTQSQTVVITDNEKRIFNGDTATLTFEVIYHPSDRISTTGVNTTFNGKPAKELKGAGSLGDPYRIIRVEVGNYNLTITENMQSNMLDQVLSTVAFTK